MCDRISRIDAEKPSPPVFKLVNFPEKRRVLSDRDHHERDDFAPMADVKSHS